MLDDISRKDLPERAIGECTPNLVVSVNCIVLGLELGALRAAIGAAFQAFCAWALTTLVPLTPA